MTAASLRRFARDDRGAAVIELALVAPIFALVVIGIVDVSNAYSRKLALEQGAQRAIEKIMQTTEDSTVEATLANEAICQVNGTKSDGTCKSAPITASNVTITYRLECSNGGTINSTQTTTSSTAFDAMTCNAGERESKYIQVNLTDKYSPMFPIHFSGIDSDGTYHIDATAGMRTE